MVEINTNCINKIVKLKSKSKFLKSIMFIKLTCLRNHYYYKYTITLYLIIINNECFFHDGTYSIPSLP